MPLSSAKVSRRVCTLHKLVDAAAIGADGVKWNHVLHYLKSNCIAREEIDDDDESTSDSSGDEANSNATKNRSNKSTNGNTKRKATKRQKKPLNSLNENPLPDYYVATEELKQEIWIDKSKGDSVLRTCLSCAPPKIIAALCFLLPEVLRTPDTENRVALHYACLYPVTETLDAVMKVLVTAYPASLLCRDDDGRTPLHYLFWFHASDRSEQVVNLFCQSLSSSKSEFAKIQQPFVQRLPKQSASAIPTTNKQDRKHQRQLEKERQNQFPLPEIPKPGNITKIPYNAAIIPDAAHGCLPLHYAIMEGASLAAIQILLEKYPHSRHSIDRYGRTPLHWYLGAGILECWNKEESHQIHVSGEPIQLEDVNCSAPAYERKIRVEIVRLLLSSRVARTADYQQRYPLHCAVSFLAHNYMFSAQVGKAMSLQIVQVLLDNFIGQLICCDSCKMTPAMLLFDTVARIKCREWSKTRGCQPMTSSFLGCQFDPPMELVEMLMKHPDPTANANVAALEDESGRLPLHVALEAASSAECIAMLMKYHPTALIHTAEDTLYVPLHSAFCHRFNAPLQNAEIMFLLLQSIKAGRHGTHVDGRLAMRMEDASGFYPIHIAASNGATSEVIRTLVERYPNTAFLTTPNGDLPIHCLMSDEIMKNLTADPLPNLKVPSICSNTTKGSSDGARELTTRSTSDEDDILRNVREKMATLLLPLLSEPAKLEVADQKYGMLPLHCAVLFEAAEYPILLRMLELYPSSASQFSRAQPPGSHVALGSCSVLDLLEIRKPKKEAVDEWQRKRELLFSFCPTHESHRHRQELLDQCVRVVIDELGEASALKDENDKNYRYHLKFCNGTKSRSPLELEITHSVSNMEKTVLQAFGFKQSRPPRKNGKNLVTSQRSDDSAAPRFGKMNKAKVEQESVVGRRSIQGKGSLRKSHSSMYDEDNTSFDVFTEVDSGDYSGEDSDELSSSSADDSIDDEEDVTDQGTDNDAVSREQSRSFGYTTSGSRLRTTFEEGSAVSDDDSRTDDSRSDDDDYSQSLSATDENETRRTSDDGESTLLSQQPTTESEKNPFDNLKEAISCEEKKEDYSFGNDIKAMLCTPKACSNIRKQKVKSKRKPPVFQKPDYISEVAMRLWAFFVLYCDPSNPNDNYCKQIADIIDEIKFSTVEKLAAIPLPPYAQHYLDADDIETLTFRDVASPKCRELIHKTCYFVGRYDFSPQQNDQRSSPPIINRSANGASVTIRAVEWLFTTEEPTAARDTGVAVENIWATGEVPAEVGVTFKASKRTVWIKFTKDKQVYDNEVLSRVALGIVVDKDEHTNNSQRSRVSGVVPLLSHYNAFSLDRKKDRTYNTDINDERFSTINLVAENFESDLMKLDMKDFPYAIVYPASSLGGTLNDFLLQNGVGQNTLLSESNRLVCANVANTIAKLHDQGFIHGDIASRSMIMSSVYAPTDISTRSAWTIHDLQHVSAIDAESMYLGGISAQGYIQFSPDTLPPEMFAKVSQGELKSYRNYWTKVQDLFKIQVDHVVTEPYVDLLTGTAYVIKCHYIPLSCSKLLPDDVQAIFANLLPYELMPKARSVDFWGLGKLIFLLTSGRSLFPVDAISGSFDYHNLVSLNPESVITEHVQDPLAQSALVSLLSSPAERETLNMDSFLSHPFFVGERSSSVALVRQIVEKRGAENAAIKRLRQRKVAAEFELGWISGRTLTINCWDFDVLEKIYMSPTAILKRMSTRKDSPNLPCNYIVLPYKLTATTPLSDTDCKVAESIGKALLELSKACFFISIMKQATSGPEECVTHKWSSSEMLRVLDLSSDEFSDVQTEMSDLAAKHVEAFRNDPVLVGLMLVQKRIQVLLSCYDQSSLYLYIVDEFTGSPVLTETYPVKVSEAFQSTLVENCVLSMHLCVLHTRGISRGVTGLLRLLFNDFGCNIPPSWTESACSLNHKLDESAFVKEMHILQDAVNGSFANRQRVGDDHLQCIYDYLSENDPTRDLAGVIRVMSAGAYTWTTKTQADNMMVIANSLSFPEALKQHRRSELKLKEYRTKLESFVEDQASN